MPRTISNKTIKTNRLISMKVSANIFADFANKYKIDIKTKKIDSELILYHD